VSLSAQSVTSSCSRPQNNSSIPCGLDILWKRQNYKRNCKMFTDSQSADRRRKIYKHRLPICCSSILTPRPNYTPNSNWMPSCTGDKGSKLEGKG
jgi:hypothetical protein